VIACRALAATSEPGEIVDAARPKIGKQAAAHQQSSANQRCKALWCGIDGKSPLPLTNATLRTSRPSDLRPVRRSTPSALIVATRTFAKFEIARSLETGGDPAVVRAKTVAKWRKCPGIGKKIGGACQATGGPVTMRPA
jgi:hypothetical protein